MDGNLIQRNKAGTSRFSSRPDERGRGHAGRSRSWRMPGARWGTPDLPPELIWIGVLLGAVLLAWISTVLLVLVAVVVGIGWLSYTGADPVHWRPGADAAPASAPSTGRNRADDPEGDHASRVRPLGKGVDVSRPSGRPGYLR